MICQCRILNSQDKSLSIFLRSKINFSMKKVKVLTNVRFAQTAGIAQVIFSFLDFIENSKKNIEVIAVNITDKKIKNIRCFNKKTGTISFGLDIPNIGKIVKSAKSLKDVEKKLEPLIEIYQEAIRKEKPDVVLINGTYFMPWCFLLAAEREGIPAISHYHGVLAKETQSYPERSKKIFLEMERCFDRKNMFYIFPSKITKEIVEEEVFGHKIKKYVVLPNPVPEYFFDKINKKKNNNIGIVSRWTKIKNVEFCEKLAKYNKKNGSKFKVNIITDIDSKHKKYKQLSKIVIFHKPVNNKKLEKVIGDTVDNNVRDKMKDLYIADKIFDKMALILSSSIII